ncbi:nucleoid-associated protein [Acinetobacter oleivorans]|uniref:nucleoid-associated protein n=1 Tax=Acinetobacter oleivorans TaxID=1148157 RepID=UPI002AAE68F0|nr:nucleoid-associated protein [Acinetobacter oleivorans]MDY7374239.1 nucleoid-associated protein [Acinetobacter oleivorans]
MAFQILNTVIHAVKKEKNSTVVTPIHREACIKNDDPLIVDFTTKLLAAYTNAANTWGDIRDPKDNIFHQDLIKWYTPSEELPYSFYDFSKDVVGQITLAIKDKNTATGGYVLMIHYEQAAVQFLMVVMLKLETRFGIDDALNMFKSETFSMDNFHESVRMNLKTWENRSTSVGEDGNPERCFAFVKKKNEDEVTRYFRVALGCENYAESAANTNHLIKATEDYVGTLQFASEEDAKTAKREKREKLHELLAEKIKNKEPVSLRWVAHELFPSPEFDIENNKLLEFIKENQEKYPIDETFKPYKPRVNALGRVKGTLAGDTTVNFPVSELNKTVFYNIQNRELTFKGVDGKMHDQIIRSLGS